MRQSLLGHVVMGLVSVVCVCVGEMPYSLLPLAVFIYVTLPTGNAPRNVVLKSPQPAAKAREAQTCAAAREIPGNGAAAARRAEPAYEPLPTTARREHSFFAETFDKTFEESMV